ncbi:MAG: hypothetical protein E5Y63_06080 [Mesorhizobium sp.]|uniref:hypothetical protein n=1 Tax=Mesorhizobium sp. TaxID=1871066 RepID=UPI0011FF60A7|nr:hypothetical protein [Mesorhizobium sp.]TIM31586.1 MAG: hypothetical protein E5Y63_06080 [Mesorhizobium sp.]
MTQADATMDKIFALRPTIRYVALYRGGELQSRQRDGVAGASASESDHYEELFVNPVLLKLARQRGDLDCGGARFVVVGYGKFHQLVVDLPDGHVSVCFELAENPIAYVERILALL